MINFNSKYSSLPLSELKKRLEHIRSEYLALFEAKAYPWSQCIKDQYNRYKSMKIAKKVCGAIKARYGKGEEGGKDLYECKCGEMFDDIDSISDHVYKTHISDKEKKEARKSETNKRVFTLANSINEIINQVYDTYQAQKETNYSPYQNFARTSLPQWTFASPSPVPLTEHNEDPLSPVLDIDKIIKMYDEGVGENEMFGPLVDKLGEIVGDFQNYLVKSGMQNGEIFKLWEQHAKKSGEEWIDKNVY